jgi:general L-amino acid transport system permease protein
VGIENVATEVRIEDKSAEVAFWRDERVLGVIYQIVAIVLLIGLFAFLITNMLNNLVVPLGFDFLGFTAGFQISFSLFPTDLNSSIMTLIVAGMLNTLLASAIGIVCATILGFFVGVMRLSSNWLIARIATGYIEIMRNVPLLVQLLFWYVAVIGALPSVRQSFTLGDAIALNNRGLFVPKALFGEGSSIVLIALAVGVALAYLIRRWAVQRQARTGQQFPSFTAGAAVVILLPLLANLVMGSPFHWEYPQLQGFNYRGGLTLQPELIALALGLTSYTAAYIAEIVRGGIRAVSHGQTEAASALGLPRGKSLRLVIVPQALRVIVPPLTSQYLNITKNSTLAGAIGYPDIYSVIGTSLNQTGRAVECVGILMLFFLIVSLTISLFMNWYNRRIALVER